MHDMDCSIDVGAGTSIAVYLPMTTVAVCIYLGIVLAGCVVVSIADSFATPEVKTRLRIADTKLIFTQVLNTRFKLRF